MDSQTFVKLIVKPIGITGIMVAECPECKKKICESRYAEMGDGDARHKFSLKKDKWHNNIRECPYCGVQFKRRKSVEKRLSWVGFRGGESAMAKNGEFTITKFRNRWLWPFRYYGETETRAENQGSAFAKEVAERMCERHKEWKV